MTIEPYGKIEYNFKEKEWFGSVNSISPTNQVELTISIDNDNEDITYKIQLLNNFVADYNFIMKKLYDLSYLKYKGTKWEKSLEEIKTMYFLTAVDLKSDDRTWWLVLEPNFDVTSIYNNFLRFTMVDRIIVWANFDVKLPH
jgi:hypothetical protein